MSVLAAIGQEKSSDYRFHLVDSRVVHYHADSLVLLVVFGVLFEHFFDEVEKIAAVVRFNFYLICNNPVA